MTRDRAKPPGLWNSHPLLWAILALPGGLILWRYGTDAATYGEVIHWTGDISAQILILTLAVTPLRLGFPRARWTVWLLRRRRDLGVASFAYAALHTIVYLLRKKDAGLIWEEGVRPDLATGWVAMMIFVALAVTSNDVSVRLLKAAWKRLHRLVYLAAILLFAHWLLAAFDRTLAMIHLGVLAALEIFRLIKSRRP